MAGDAGPAAVSVASQHTPSTDSADGAADGDLVAAEGETADTTASTSIVSRLKSWWSARAASPTGLGLVVGAVTMSALSAVALWFGYQTYQGHQTQRERAAFLAVARQGAVDLTTVDATRVEADIKRVLDASTGDFREEFQRRSGPFVDEVRRTKSKSVGSVEESGVETMDTNSAAVLVAVKVSTTQEKAPDPRIKGWRMRITVERVGPDIKVSKVEFVP